MNFFCLTICIPLISFILIVFSRKKFSNYIYNFIGVIPVFICFILINYFYINFFDTNKYIEQNYWNIFSIHNFYINFGLYLDNLSLTMLQVITGVGFLIQLFSIWYMSNKSDISRFFAYLNLFISSMNLLVLSNNLLLTYIAWEIVGFCSYVLIGFYYVKKKNIKSSMKAFIITRIGDLFILFAIFLILFKCHTLDFSKLNIIFLQYHDLPFNNVLILSALFIFLGTITKSAQFPFQVWLTKAMVGPTPVSALIHSATMITAGVYLIIRMHNLFELSSLLLTLISIVGSITIILSSISAIFENNIKKILAYSTMSQIGYMFLGLGMKLWDLVVAHLVVHSFFKALLFLSSGSLIFSCYNEVNILRMGGLRYNLKLLYFMFMIGVSSLIALPVITSSFYTKGSIIWNAFIQKYYFFFLIGIIGSFLTSIYASRFFFLIFFDKLKILTQKTNNFFNLFPLFILCILSSVLGVFSFRPILDISIYSEITHLKKNIFEIFLSILIFLGIFVSYYYFLIHKQKTLKTIKKKEFSFILYVLKKNFGLDCFYKIFFINSFEFIKKFFYIDYIENLINIFYILLKKSNQFLIIFQNESLRLYILFISLGIMISILFINIIIYIFYKDMI
ncbi:NADH-quinone oxidoreductase subunit L [Buchnera aphidicola]|uniref:NADH-quinone oxidoreductase subunit L n=1 Tax=Buchnera aphidicola TaxID=9 RepID=UPI002237BA70|nr:NADH-quinone oxidoreductase subunit L [Buchnera aphidicola]MCW5197658.1 NADH-quinone oxidoreductase subunit L [Buchnera aphidicola (Chaitophorus viminalis)]